MICYHYYYYLFDTLSDRTIQEVAAAKCEKVNNRVREAGTEYEPSYND